MNKNENDCPRCALGDGSASSMKKRVEAAWAAYYAAVKREEKAKKATADAQWKAEDMDAAYRAKWPNTEVWNAGAKKTP